MTLLRRQHVVQVGEDRLLHLARIGGAADQHDLAGEVAGDDRLGAAAVAGRIGLEGGQVDDRQGRDEARELGEVRADQQVADEQRVPGELGEDPRPAPGISGRRRRGDPGRTAPCPRRVLQEVGQEHVELLAGDRAVVVPPDRALGGGVADHELVLRRAAGMDPGIGQERPAGDQHGLAAGDGLLVEGRRLEVPDDALQIAEAESLGAVRAVEHADIVHRLTLLGGRDPVPKGGSRRISCVLPVRVLADPVGSYPNVRC